VVILSAGPGARFRLITGGRAAYVVTPAPCAFAGAVGRDGEFEAALWDGELTRGSAEPRLVK